jgi:hypothetical protein
MLQNNCTKQQEKQDTGKWAAQVAGINQGMHNKEMLQR